MNIQQTLDLHRKWLRGEAGGVRADLRDSDLRDSDLSDSDLRDSDLSGSDLRGSDLSYSNLRGSNLRYSDLRGSNLSDSNLRYSDLRGSNLSDSNLCGSNLRDSNLSDSDLCGSNLRGSTGIISQCSYMQEHFEHDRRGFIVYKTFNSQYSAPAGWVIAPGSIIEEVVNPNRTDGCGCGVNVATLEWVKKQGGGGDIWKCRIAWKDAPGIVVPYNTDGKIRAERVELIEVVPR